MDKEKRFKNRGQCSSASILKLRTSSLTSQEDTRTDQTKLLTQYRAQFEERENGIKTWAQCQTNPRIAETWFFLFVSVLLIPFSFLSTQLIPLGPSLYLSPIKVIFFNRLVTNSDRSPSHSSMVVHYLHQTRMLTMPQTSLCKWLFQTKSLEFHTLFQFSRNQSKASLFSEFSTETEVK